MCRFNVCTSHVYIACGTNWAGNACDKQVSLSRMALDPASDSTRNVVVNISNHEGACPAYIAAFPGHEQPVEEGGWTYFSRPDDTIKSSRSDTQSSSGCAQSSSGLSRDAPSGVSVHDSGLDPGEISNSPFRTDRCVGSTVQSPLLMHAPSAFSKYAVWVVCTMV